MLFFFFLFGGFFNLFFSKKNSPIFSQKEAFLKKKILARAPIGLFLGKNEIPPPPPPPRAFLVHFVLFFGKKFFDLNYIVFGGSLFSPLSVSKSPPGGTPQKYNFCESQLFFLLMKSRVFSLSVWGGPGLKRPPKNKSAVFFWIFLIFFLLFFAGLWVFVFPHPGGAPVCFFC